MTSDGQLLIGSTSANAFKASALTAGAGIALSNGDGSILVSATGSPALTYSIVAYGAVGDNSTDNVTAIQNCVNACSAAGGGYVYTPPGIFLMTDGITVPGNIIFYGEGAQSLWKFKTGSTLTKQMFAMNTAHNVTIRNMGLDGNNLTGWLAIVGAVYCNNLRIYDNYITGFSRFGIAVQAGDYTWIERNYIYMATPSTAQNSAVQIGGNLNTAHGFIKDNFINGSCIGGAAAKMEISGNHVTNFKYGAGINGGGPPADVHEMVIANNTVHGEYAVMDDDGFYVKGMEIWTPNATITGNIVYNNSGSGLVLGGQNASVTGNIIFDNNKGAYVGVDAGIMLIYYTSTANANNAMISGNRCYDTLGSGGTQKYGYADGGGLTGVVLSGNNFAGNKTGDYLIQSVSTKDDYFGANAKSVVSTFTNLPATGIYGDGTSLNLQPGDYDLTLQATISRNSAASTIEGFIGISTTSGNSTTGLTLGDNKAGYFMGSNFINSTFTITNYRVSITSATTYYAKIMANYSTGTPQYALRLSATKVKR